MKFSVPRPRARATFSALTLSPLLAEAHVFSQPYALPVPFTVYAGAAATALLLSFVTVGVFAALPASGHRPSAARVHAAHPAKRVSPTIVLGQLCSVGLLLLCILSGLLGSQNAFVNFNMTCFWIGFVLGLPYLVALVGDVYAPLNPWKALANLTDSATGGGLRGRFAYPQRLGFAPALALYMAFIWLELFAQLLPRGLSVALGVYTIVNLAGAWVFGIDAWFRYGEFFGVFLRLVGRMSPRARSWDPAEQPAARAERWRYPFVGLLEAPAAPSSLVLFILFMLSSTAFDGLHSTLPWVSLYWKHIHPSLAPWLGPDTPASFRRSTGLYYAWQWAALLVSPFAYLGAFAGAIGILKVLTGCRRPMSELVGRFAMSLVPIAFVYHLTHYYTLLFAQGPQLVVLASDPMGWGWNLFGTARQPVAPIMLDVGHIWLTQVTLIVVGHVVGVYLAHLEALRLYGSAGRAALSQVPMLGLMMVFTVLGLWILSLPIAGG